MSEPKKVDRRNFIYAGLGAVALIAIGAVAYVAMNPPVVTQTVTTSTTVPTTSVVTTTVPTTSPTSITIHQFIHANDPARQYEVAMPAAWAKVNPNIRVVPIKMPSGYTEGELLEVNTAKARSPDIDIFNIDVIWGPLFADNLWVEPLDDILPPSEQSKFIPAMIDSMTWNKHIWAVPWMYDQGALWYRKDILDEEGIKVPTVSEPGWTWDEFISICENLKEKYPDLAPYIVDQFKYEEISCIWTEILASNGGAFFDEDGLIRVNDSQGVEALQKWYDMVNKHKIFQPGTLSMQLDPARVMFVDDAKGIFHRNWNYVWGTSLEATSKVKGKIWVGAFPHFPGHQSAHCEGGWNWAISAGSLHKKEAKEYVKWLTSYDVMKAIMLAGGYSQARIDLYNDPDIQKVWEPAGVYYNLAKYTVSRPKHPLYLQISSFIQDRIHGCLSGLSTPKEALDGLADDLAKLTGAGISPLVKK